VIKGLLTIKTSSPLTNHTDTNIMPRLTNLLSCSQL